MKSTKSDEHSKWRFRVDIYTPETGHVTRTYSVEGPGKCPVTLVDIVTAVEERFPKIAARSDVMAFIRQYVIVDSEAILCGGAFTPRDDAIGAGWWYDTASHLEDYFMSACRRNNRPLKKAEAIVALGDDK